MTTAPAAAAPPPARGWLTASHKRECPTCTRDIGKGDPVALVVTTTPDGDPLARHVCAACTSSPKPGRTR